MNVIKTTPFDTAKYLDSEEAIAEYVDAVLAEDDPALFLAALSDVAKARGMTKMAKDAELGRESLYKALVPGTKTSYDTVLKLARAAGVKLMVAPLQPRRGGQVRTRPYLRVMHLPHPSPDIDKGAVASVRGWLEETG